MEIICHRGFWKSLSKKTTEPSIKQNSPSIKQNSPSIKQNSILSFQQAFENGFGIETDIRDYNGNLVISHGIPLGKEASLEELFKLYNKIGNNLPLALNIKSSELQQLLTELINRYEIENYFLFDMAIPDAIKYLKTDNIKIYTRQSEHELEPNLYKESIGIWMDEFYSNWIDLDHIEKHINNNKKIALVSPELHGKEHLERWKIWKKIEQKLDCNLSICVNCPEEANIFFNS